VLEEPGAGAHACSARRASPVTASEFALGLHAASLVRDGGSLQIGIGCAVGRAGVRADPALIATTTRTARRSRRAQRRFDELCGRSAATRRSRAASTARARW
jgi:hypothetical protein